MNANIRELAMHTIYFTNAEVEREFSFIVMFVCYCPVTDVKQPETNFKINSYLINDLIPNCCRSELRFHQSRLLKFSAGYRLSGDAIQSPCP